MGKRFAAALAVIFVLTFGSAGFCGYRQALTRADRNARLFSFETWDAKLIWHATFFSDDFRRAYEDKHIEVNYLNEEDAALFIEDQEYRQSKGWEFFISFYTKKDYKRVANESGSFWKLHMITSSGEVIEPLEIEAIPITPYERIMFRHLNRWSKAYRITFPKVDLGDHFELTAESVVGKSTLKWKVKY